MKTTIKNYPLIHPTTIVVVGTVVDGKTNFTTIGDIAVAGINPALIMISINENHNCMKFIKETNKMSVNIPTASLLSEVDYCGMYSSKTNDKSRIFEHEIIEGLPVITKAPITLFLKVEQTCQIQQRVVLVCSVTKTLVEESLIKNKKLDLSSISPILYGLDNKYYSDIKQVGVGYAEAKKLEVQQNNK